MLPVVDKPVIQYVVEEAMQTGIDDILIITGRNKRAIEDHFDKLPECTQPFSKYRAQEHGKSVQHFDEWPDILLCPSENAKRPWRRNTPCEASLRRGTICGASRRYHHGAEKWNADLASQLIDGFERFGSSTMAIEPVNGEMFRSMELFRERF